MRNRNLVPTNTLPEELANLAKEVFKLAEDLGLSYFPIKFLCVSPKELNGIAAYGGFPFRIPHWTNGANYIGIHKEYTYGVSKIYELVINTNPVYAYLLNTNTLVDQKLVMSHVCGHADFFYNNAWFKKTNRNMLDQMANNASRVRRISEQVGETQVEDFIDICLSIDNLIDPYAEFIKRKDDPVDEDIGYQRQTQEIGRLRASGYMDRYINPRDYLEEQKKKQVEKQKEKKKFPTQPDRDVLGFLIEHAPLERWQRDILAMIREESYYFAPQRMTKIINEGFACWVHTQLMTEHLVTDSEIVDYCDRHAGTISPSRNLNPYRLGLMLLRDIEDRWNKGRFGPEYENCDSLEEKLKWDRNLGLGKEKILEVRKVHNDLTLIDNYLTPELCVEQKLFSFKENQGLREVSENFSDIKNQLLQMLSNGGQPVIEIEDGNYGNRGELLLNHKHDGRSLDMKKGKPTLWSLYKLWNRPVHLKTVEDGGNEVLWSWDLNGFKTS